MENETIIGVYVEVPGQPKISYASQWDFMTGWRCICGEAAFGFSPIVGDSCKCGVTIRHVRKGRGKVEVSV